MGQHKILALRPSRLLIFALAAAGFVSHASAKAPSSKRQCAIEARYPGGVDRTGKNFDAIDTAKAIAICSEALRKNPNDGDTEANLARALLASKDEAGAKPHLERAVEAGSAQALLSLAGQIRDGRGYPKDVKRALLIYTELAAKGDERALYNIGITRSGNDPDTRDLPKAFEAFEAAAKKKLPTAAYRLGLAYRDGLGVAKDPAAARHWLLQSARAGNSDAIEALGALLIVPGTPPAEKKIVAKELQRLGKGGDALAQSWSGYVFDQGLGAPRNHELAVSWYQRAIRGGNSRSLILLGNLFQTGSAGVKDADRAAREYCAALNAGDVENAPTALARNATETAYQCLTRAIEANNTSAMFGRALLLSDVDARRDDAAALADMRRAADGGFAQANVLLGRMLVLGRSVFDPKEAVRQLEIGLAKGEDNARVTLAELYASGIGTPRDGAKSRQLLLEYSEKGGVFEKKDAAAHLREGLIGPFDIATARKLLLEAGISTDDSSAEDYATIASRPTSPKADRARVLDTIRTSAAGGAGWAIAALAYPGPSLVDLVPDDEQVRWKGTISQPIEGEKAVDIAKALTAGRLAAQTFDIAFKLVGANAGPASAARFEIESMRQLRLEKSALRRLAGFLRSDAGKGATAAERDMVVLTFDADADTVYDVGPDLLGDLEIAALGGSKRASMALSLYFRRPGGSENDRKLSDKWVARATELGSINALNLSAVNAEQGMAQTVDLSKALQYWIQAANRGDRLAAHNLSRYYRGAIKGAVPDPVKAFRWTQLATLTDPTPIRHSNELLLVRMYVEGKGTRKDLAEALAIMQELIVCDYNPARVEMAKLYQAGLGVPRDDMEALRWLRLASSYGDADGAEAMVAGAVFGIGQAVDARIANFWIAEAIKRGSKNAKDWQDACGKTASIACLDKRRGLSDWRYEKGAAGGAPSASVLPFADRERQARAELDSALARPSSIHTIDLAYNNLETLYMLFGKADEQFSLSVQWLAQKESQNAEIYGSSDNYFALIGSSCSWYKASQRARILKQPEAALFFAKVSVNKLQLARQKISQLPDELRECFIELHKDRYRYLAEQFLALGRFGEAENVLDMLKDFEHYNYTRDARTTADRLKLMPLDKKQQDALHKFDAVVASLSAAARIRDELTPEEESLAPDAQVRLASARSQLDAANTTFRADVADLKTLIGSLDQPQARLAQSVRLDAVRPSLIGKVQQFGKGAAIVHAVVLADKIQWLVTTGSFQRSIVVPIDATDLRQLVGSYRESIKSPSADKEAAAIKLYKSTFEPVDRALRAAGIERVMLSLDDCLRYVPFAALNDGADWLVKRYAFSVFSSVSELDGYKPDIAGWNVAGFGASGGTARFAPLPGAETELKSIVAEAGSAGVLPGIIRMDGKFNDAAFRVAISGSYRVVHIASHFALDPFEIGKSVMLMGDGTELPLTKFSEDGGYTFRNVDLLTLSACDTAMSNVAANGSEFDSLATIAINAGANAVMATLWPVSDKSTAALMKLFYDMKGRHGLTKSEALRSAQIAMIDGQRDKQSSTVGPDYSDPFFWAALLVIGNPQ